MKVGQLLLCSLCPYRHWFVRLRRLPGVRCTPMRVPTALQGSFDDRYVEIDDRDFTRLKSGITFHEISFSDFRTSIVHVEKERQVGNGIARRMALERDHGHAVEHMLRRDHAVMRGAGGGVARA